ncbi:MAG: elongation factor P, partial [Nitrospinae bacterium]|nr:elongation factor P [Nitrospinota bacterium]
MIPTSQFRNGLKVELDGEPFVIVEFQHVKPGKGGAFVQVEMKDISAGTKLNERFRSEDRVERAHVEARSMQYLYQEGDDHVFMDNQTYEQMSLTADELEGQLGYLKPDTEVQINFYNDRPIGLELPATVILEVVETEGTVKGQTAAGSGKPA